MAKLKQSLTVDGAKLSNLDPDLEISLESNPNVFIESIGEDTITYGFNGFPDEDTTYQLNLTFTYMGLISYVAPLNIVQRALAEDPIIVDVAPISVETGKIYQAPFRVILPISGRDVTSGYAISTLEDNAGTHTDYLAKTNGLFFKVETADADDYVGTYKFTVTGTHNGQPVTLSADVPVTIKKWTGSEYRVVFNDGTNNTLIGAVEEEGSFNYRVLRRNKVIPSTEYKADLTSLEVSGSEGALFSDLVDSVVDETTRKVSFTMSTPANQTVVFKVTDPSDEPIGEVPVTAGITSDAGLAIIFIDSNERILKGNRNDVLRVSPSVTMNGIRVLPTDPKLQLSAVDPTTGEDVSSVTVVSKNATHDYWEVRINATVANTAGGPIAFKWEATYDTTETVQVDGTVSVYSDTASQITGAITTQLISNVVQSALVQFIKPTYGEGPNWALPGSKLTEVSVQIRDQQSNTQIGVDVPVGDYTVDADGIAQVDLPKLPFKSSWVYIKGKLLAKNGVDGSGPHYTPVNINPQIFKSVGAEPIVATPVDNKINFTNNASTKVIFKLTQVQDDVVVPINAIDITELTVAGKGFTTASAVKETEAGTYSVIVQGMGEKGDANVIMKVQYPLGETQTVVFALKAVKILPVVTDSPLTVSMWQTGNQVPFVVTLAGTDVTANLTEVKVLDNPYVKSDSGTGTKKVWEILYAETTVKSTKVGFSYKLVVDGVNTEFTAEGTFNLPAWDGVAFKVIPFTENDPKFTSMRIKAKAGSSINLSAMVKGVKATTKSTFDYVPEGSELHGSTITLTDGNATTGRVTTITAGSEVGTNKLKIKFANSVAETGGYPADTEGLSMGYWEPEVEVWDDVLTVTPSTQSVTGIYGGSVNIPLQLVWNGEALPLQTAGITYTFAPNDVLTRTGFDPDGSLICTLAKNVEEDTTIPVELTVTYSGKSQKVNLDVTVQPNLIKDFVVTNKTLNVKIWDAGDEYPFTAVDGNGVDVTDKLTKVEIVPNTYIVSGADHGGKLWYVTTAETTARNIPTKCILTFTIDSREYITEIDSTFIIAAWDGITLKVNADYPKQGDFTLVLDETTSYIFRPTYEGKPAADKVRLEQITNLIRGELEIVSQEVVEDGAGVKVTLRASGATDSNAPTFRYRLLGTTGGVVNKDYADDANIHMVFTPAGLYIHTRNNTPAQVGPNGVSKGTIKIYFHGVGLPPNDPNLKLVFDAGSILDYLGADSTSFYARNTTSVSGSVVNNYTLTYVRDGVEHSVRNYWTIGRTTTATPFTSVNVINTPVPSSDNELDAPLYVRPANTIVTTVDPITPYLVTTSPINGGHLIDPENVKFLYKNSKMVIVFKAGHSGGTFTITGYVNANGQPMALIPATYTVPKAPVSSVGDQPSYTLDENNQTTVKIKLSQLRYGSAIPYTFPGGMIKGVTVTNATNDGLVAQDEDGYFGIILTATGSQSITVAGTITDSDGVDYPFSLNTSVIKEFDLTITDNPLTVNVWDKGTTPPFKVMDGDKDITASVVDLKVTSIEGIIEEPTGYWKITATAAQSAKTVVANFTYRISGDNVYRNASGTFNINTYDGREFNVMFAPGGGNSGGVLVLPTNPSNPAVNSTKQFRMAGVYKGDQIVIKNTGLPVDNKGLLEITNANTQANPLTSTAKALGSDGQGVITALLRRPGTTGDVEGVDVATLKIPYLVYVTSPSDKYYVVDMTRTLTGKKGDELFVKCRIYNRGVPIDLTNPTHTFDIPGGKMELVPGSVVAEGFKLRFIADVVNPITFNQSIKIQNSTSPSLVTEYENISVTQNVGVRAPNVTDQTTAMSLQLWEQKPIVFKVMVGDTDITSGASLTLNNDISSNLEFDLISEGVWGIKAIAADPLEDVTLLVKVNVHVNHDGNDYVLPFEFNTTVVANTAGVPTNRFNIEFI